jgi:hypothetical protein
MIPLILYAASVLWLLTPSDRSEVVLLTVDPDTLPYGRRPAGF